ncbi:acetyl-CoA carboxylase biotin carboxyl carrier protein [Aquibaculum arenosum]|uniref:Biotin carboxyl carrier protein of acetyl-CoA carboxylase n=1 Tax=Aquibaculum arenosum TaxID=3032591 RepID=A0ABT5YNI5_9PROT|nr:acetyl-CoA carboxylase biotin carboxyl carrier protein [Fodinicurvata sp. CAU 1616]MDF2096531.1 acetyl-CoA carboxylase biotin carboxyl carrier protein [Fodinicurvata sp. CAU 1616]
MNRKFPLDEDALRRLASILEDTGLTEIEVEAGDHRIRVAKTPAAVHAAPLASAASAQTTAEVGPATPAAAESGSAVTSPMVGTAYLASEPGAKPFVQPGDTVAEGQTLLIIEAMKVMNALPAPRAGRVSQILVQDGQPVEFGEPLLVLE